MDYKLLFIILIVCVMLFSGWNFAVAQRANSSNGRPLAESYDKAVKSKEPKFRQTVKSKEKRGRDEYLIFDWAKGDSSVNIESIELDSAEEASAALQAALNVPVGVGTPKTKLTNLGDEAYLNVSPHGSAQMFIRIGNVYLRLNATSPKLAKRFARHLVDSIGVE
jgi:hypothetical protein